MASRKNIRIGTRGSKLALAQADEILKALKEKRPDLDCSINVIKTLGDARHDKPIDQLDRIGIFTAELDDALLEKRIDLAVHSLKDTPSEVSQGLALAAVTKRISKNDVMIVNPGALDNQVPEGISSLPQGFKVGTSSLRRRAMLKHHHPGLEFTPLRGNLDTRLRKLGEGQADAIVVAEAGLLRLGIDPQEQGFIQFCIPMEIMIPAPGQGALALETREDDREIIDLVSFLDHEQTAACVKAERAAMNMLGLGCRVPAGFFAGIKGDAIVLEGEVAHVDGNPLIRDKAQGPKSDPQSIGLELAEKLLSLGADDLVKASRS